ncbi:GAF sensor hybrid histidine kinase [Geoalkalibacter ferrihydriticus]|nr:response regulator [Geoalkalibacter ferrihydriticus]SDL49136.1 GAF sensor hybrid histidine kinase [Geoalkalibacter ferrihydriticus]
MDLPDRNDAAPGILLVDDTPFFRQHAREMLEGRGYRVVATGNGSEVPAVLSTDEICVVLTDLHMPDMSGIELLQTVKELRPELPVIIISSHEDFSAARQVLRHGALDYLVKPVDDEELAESVQRALNTYRASLREASAQREAQRRLSDLILLKQIGETASNGADLQILFDKIVDSITLSADVEMVSLMLRDDAGNLSIAAARGLSSDIMNRAKVAPGEGISGHVLATGRPILITDLSRDQRFHSAGDGDRYKNQSLLSVPIRIKDRVLGVINVNNKRTGNTFKAEDQNLLTTIAHQVALAIENFKLVSSLRQQARELEEANRHLVKFNKARSQLVCNLSHELKTPLTSILGFVDLIINFFDHIEREELRDYLGKVHSESLHMEKLITGMLRLFSIDSGGERWDWRTFSVEGLLSEALTRRGSDIAEKDLQPVIQAAEDLHDVLGDPEKTGILINALVDNAVKFNRDGGRIQVQLENQEIDGKPYIYMRIHNDGLAVPVEAGEDIFNEYTQLGDINTEKPTGVGIGLAICKAILGRMGGRIALEKTIGEGTTFGVYLPTG